MEFKGSKNEETQCNTSTPKKYSAFDKSSEVILEIIWKKTCKPFNTWCPLKGHTYLNKPVAFRYRYV